jgi:hypothetical protein
MEFDEIYGFQNVPFTGTYIYKDKLQYLLHLDFPDYSGIQNIIDDNLDDLINEKYLKYSEKEPQQPAGSGRMVNDIMPMRTGARYHMKDVYPNPPKFYFNQ